MTFATIKSTVEIEVSPLLDRGEKAALFCDFELSTNGVPVSTILMQSLSHRGDTVSVIFNIPEPELWYPHGYGKQPLYSITATLKSKQGEVLDTATKRVGIRKARVVQRPLKDAPGTTFFFEVNNIPIFCGGSNWIPADNFIPRITAQKYKDWLQMLVDGNQVMTRFVCARQSHLRLPH